MNLAALQARFRDWLVTGDEADAAVFGTHAAAGLNVYQNNYRVQLMGCLEVSYPLLRRFIGEEAFRAAAITHIDTKPPRGWTLDHYGADFAETLRALHPHNPDLDELAWIEWMLGEAFVAADAVPLNPESLACIDWDRTQLILASSVRVRSATTNADDVWMALRQDEHAESEMLPDCAGLVIWRKDHIARLRRTDGTELLALRQLASDPSLEALCDAVFSNIGEDVGIQRVGRLLADWVSAGMVTHATDGRSFESS